MKFIYFKSNPHISKSNLIIKLNMEHNPSNTLDTNEPTHTIQLHPTTLVSLNLDSSRRPDSNELKTICDFLEQKVMDTDSFITLIHEFEKAFEGYRKQGLFVPIELKQHFSYSICFMKDMNILEKHFESYREQGFLVPIKLKSDKNERRNDILFLRSQKSYLTINITYFDIDDFIYKLKVLSSKTNITHSVIRTDLQFLSMISLFSIFNNSNNNNNDNNVTSFTTLSYKDGLQNSIITSFPNLMYLDARCLGCCSLFENSYINSSLLTSLNINVNCKCLNLSKILECCPNLKNIGLFYLWYHTYDESNLVKNLSTLAKDGRVFERVKIKGSFDKLFQVPFVADNARLRIKTLIISSEFCLSIKDKEILQTWKHFFKIDRLLMSLDDNDIGRRSCLLIPVSIFYCSDDELIQLIEVLESLECIIVSGLKFYRVTSRNVKTCLIVGFEEFYYRGKHIIEKQYLNTLNKEWLVKYLGWLYIHRKIFVDIDFRLEIEDKYNIFTFCNGSVIPKNHFSNHTVSSIHGFFNSGLFDCNLLGIVFNFIPKTKDTNVNKRGIKRGYDEVGQNQIKCINIEWNEDEWRNTEWYEIEWGDSE